MATWEQVRDEWGKAEQMGHQAVLQAAKVGQMLIELKAECPQRSGLPSFQTRLKTEMPDVSHQTIANLMTLARNLPLLEEKKPESQRAALQLIKEVSKREEVDMETVTWSRVAYSENIAKLGSGGSWQCAKKAIDAIDPGARDSGDELRIRTACKAVAEKRAGKSLDDRYAEHRQEIATQPENVKEKVDRLVQKETQLLRESFQTQVRKEFENTMPDRLAELEKQEQRLTREIKKYQMMRDGIGLFMTEEEYKLVKGVCHPDREADAERKAKAFNVMQRLESYFSTVKA